jgi:predicted O-linked N-acetylglucosamine transferase (SPINDLY family)
MDAPTLEHLIERGLEHHQAGQLAEAERIYTQVLQQHPEHAVSLHYLGIIAYQTGRLEMAASLIRHSLTIDPDSPDALINLANVLRLEGNLPEANTALRQAIRLDPASPEAHSNLGNILREQGLLDDAIDICRKAIDLEPDFAQAYNNLGNALRDKGDLEKAAQAYRQTLALDDRIPEVHGNLGAVLQRMGDPNAAVAAFRQAVALRPTSIETLNSLGIALWEGGYLEEAATCHKRGIALHPAIAESYSNLGNVQYCLGNFAEAIESHRKAIELKPDRAVLYCNLGIALQAAQSWDEALAAYRQALAIDPNCVDAICKLGDLAQRMERLDEAIDWYQKAHTLVPDSAEMVNSLGAALNIRGRYEEAMQAFRKAITIKPDYADAYYNLGNFIQTRRGELEGAIELYQKALSLKPYFAAAANNLGNVYKDKGQLDEAIAWYQTALSHDPAYVQAHSNLILAMHYHPRYGKQAIAQEFERWNRSFGDLKSGSIAIHENTRNPDRPLKIGYVSPDFRDHPVGWFLRPLLTHHDRENFELYAYSQARRPDKTTASLSAFFDSWHDVARLSDMQAADLIRRDRIDILVDLSLHSADNRLPVFALKPAPLQISYLGYAGSSGLTTMDYRISDPYLDPIGDDESGYSEQTIRLPHTYWCYSPVVDLPIQPPPTQIKGFITFGCLNNFCKVNDHALGVWARILQTVPDSQLLLFAPKGEHRERLMATLEQQGIGRQRVRFAGKASTSDFIGLYQSIDIALDTYPFGGGTTTFDALWMGVPVVSLRGDMAVGRAGLSILSNIGLEEFVGRTPDEYVQIAVKLADDRPRLNDLRHTLRPRMQSSLLMDGPRFARDIEMIYRRLWQNWCPRFDMD